MYTENRQVQDDSSILRTSIISFRRTLAYIEGMEHIYWIRRTFDPQIYIDLRIFIDVYDAKCMLAVA